MVPGLKIVSGRLQNQYLKNNLVCVTLSHQLHNQDTAQVLTVMNHTAGLKLPRALENGLMDPDIVLKLVFLANGVRGVI